MTSEFYTPPGPAVDLGVVFDELDRVTTSEGIQASDWHLFRDAVFGRDSAQVGLDVVDVLPHRAATIVGSLAARQGQRRDDRSEEEPGRIHHEWRSEWIGRRRSAPESIDIMRLLQTIWGDPDSDELCYYGTVDATCLFVILTQRVVARLGPATLTIEVLRRDRSVASLRESVTEAAEWITGRVRSSDIGLLEFRRSNPEGLRWQALRDGALSYQHADGGMANSDAPIASLEVQGLAHDALLAATELLGDGASSDWARCADDLRSATLRRFTAATETGFCMALDRDPGTGQVRQLQVETTLAGELLDTSLLDRSTSDEELAGRVVPIVRHLFGPSMLTAVGLRARSLDHRSILEPKPHGAYQGSLTSWAVMTNIVSRGLARVGLPRLAADLDRRILDGIAHSGFSEAWWVDEDGAVALGAQESDRGVEERVLATASAFEHSQAWTISAALRALRTRHDHANEIGWRADLEEECLALAAQCRLEDVPRCRFRFDRAEGEAWTGRTQDTISPTARA